VAEHSRIEQLDQIIDAVLAGGTPAQDVEPDLAPLAEIVAVLRLLPRRISRSH
jgi:hypothetical protein